MKILLTGFKRYATHDTNPSEEVLKVLDLPDTKKVVLDVSYADAVKQLKEAIKAYKPDLIISLGLSPYRQEPTMEQYAYNEMRSIQPDETGVLQNEGKELIPGSPKSLHTTTDLARLEQVLAAQGVSASISIDPGRFVCNAVYYNALHSGVPALFIHLPLFKDCPIEDDVEVVKAIVGFYRC